MKIFEIRDQAFELDEYHMASHIRSEVSEGKLLGYLFYYERSRRFFTELLSDVDEWECPFIFEDYVKRREYSIDSERSMKFVGQRIIPHERQNIGEILRNNRLKEYDEYSLLVLSEGRCAQDNLYIEKTDEEHLADEIRLRLMRKVSDVIPISGERLLVFFKDDTTGIVNVMDIVEKDKGFVSMLRREDGRYFNNANVAPGGNGVEWGSGRFISAEKLYETAETLPLNMADILNMVRYRMADTTDATKELGCSRQYINQLVKDGKLNNVMNTSNNKLFLRSELEML